MLAGGALSAVGLALGLLAILAGGDRCLALAGCRLPSGAYRLGMAFAAGLVVATVVPFWLNLAGVPLAPWLAVAPGALFLALWAASRRSRPAGPTSGLPGSARWAILAAALFVALATARTAWEPLAGWDSRSLWGLYTSHLYHERSVSGPAFTDPDRALQHANYPLLVPLARWDLACWMGELEDHLSLALFPACFLALLALIHGRLARKLQPPLPSFLVAVLAGLPVFWLARDGSVFSGYADVPLTLLSGGLVVSCLEWLESRDSSWLRVAALLGAGAIFTKRGGVLLALLALCLVLLLERRDRSSVARAALACAMLAVPWWLHQATLTLLAPSPPQNYAARLYAVAVERGDWATRGPELVLGALHQTFLALASWSLLWWAVLASAALQPLQSPSRRLLGMGMLVYALATWLFLLRGGQAVDGTNWARYLMPLSPWAVLFLGAGFEPAAAPAPGPGPRPSSPGGSP